MAERFITMAENVSAMKEKLEILPELKKTVDKHERAYNVGKVVAVPALGLFHVGIKHLLSKIGW